MYTETDMHVISDGQGYSWLHAKRRADATGKIAVEQRTPEVWEEADAEHETW